MASGLSALPFQRCKPSPDHDPSIARGNVFFEKRLFPGKSYTLESALV